MPASPRPLLARGVSHWLLAAWGEALLEEHKKRAHEHLRCPWPSGGECTCGPYYCICGAPWTDEGWGYCSSLTLSRYAAAIPEVSE